MNGTTNSKPAMTDAEKEAHFPWAGQSDAMACNLAFANLVRALPGRLSIDGKMHAPSLMAAAGAVAGICAQVSLLADAERLAQAQAAQTILEMRLKDGRVFFYGDALNEMLYSVSDPVLARSRVWNMMVTCALRKGMDMNSVPNVPAMFKHVSESFGTNMEGYPSVEEKARPLMAVRELLQIVGPGALAALTGEVPEAPGEDIRPNRKSWVAISAQAAASTLLQASRIMPPELCLKIAMESAMYASKLRAKASSEEQQAAQA